ncbi:MAG: septum formation family protein [Acidimicrobiia bacterium]|nr:septum formation family protein [Acidimicrobiia bacterium]
MTNTRLKILALASAVIVLITACDTGLTGVENLEVGDCFDDPSDTEDIAFIQTVSCDEPHQNEVYATLTLTEFETYPGRDTVDDAALVQCLELFEDYVGAPYETSSLDIAFLTPTEESWSEGDRGATCALYSLDGQMLVGSMRGTGR